jgi:hypothetical protein
MRTSVILTVDVEAAIAYGITRYAQGYRPMIDQYVACNIDGRSEGLGFLMRTLAEYGLRATFFVEAAQANYFGPSAMGRYVDQLLSANQDVQLHVHPCWLSFHDGVPDAPELIDDGCAGRTERALEGVFSQCIDTFRAWTGHHPLALRTGNFCTGREVFRAMSTLGVPLSSSLCVGVFEPAEPEYNLPHGFCVIEGVREYPATCFLDVRCPSAPRFRPLQITACSSREMISLLNQAHAAGFEQVVVVTHAFEYVKPISRTNRNEVTYANLAITRIVRSRLRRLCRYLSEHDDRFEVCTFADLASRPPPSQRLTQPLRGSLLLSWLRTVSNVLRDHVRGL